MNMKIHGIQAKIIFCVGSAGAGFSFCCIHMLMPSTMASAGSDSMCSMLPGAGVA